jgi:hypothetical protein
MRSVVLALALLAALLSPAAVLRAGDDDGAGARRRLAQGLASALVARRAEVRPQTHATDFGNEAIGCITLTRRELRRFGYAGHAVLCEEGATAQVLGGVLTANGRLRCQIAGFYAGDLCYRFDICGFPETACVS